MYSFILDDQICAFYLLLCFWVFFAWICATVRLQKDHLHKHTHMCV